MDEKLALLGSIALLVMLAGCMGSSEGSKNEPEMEVRNSTLPISGIQSGLAQAQPEELMANVPIILEFNQVTKIQVNITIEDGDADTNADQVGTMTLGEETGNHTSTANGGNAADGSPVTAQIILEWDGTQYLSERWVLDIPVTINGGNDQWIGPLIWRGVPDRGFSYTLDVYYEYHEKPA